MRAAFDLAIDRNALNQVVFNGEFLAGNQWVKPKHPNYVAEYPIPKRDVAKAKALLAEAGQPSPDHPHGLRQQRGAPGRSSDPGDDQGGGLRRELQATDFTTALDAADKGNYEAYLYSWSGRPDPDGNTFSFLACKAPLNYPRYCSPEAEAALQAERGSVDPGTAGRLGSASPTAS